MLLLVLLPIIPAVWWIAKRSPADAVLDVFLPVLLLIPPYYVYEIPHFMPVNAWEAALFPIVVATLFKYGRQWRFQRSDLWIVLFVIGDGIAEGKYGFSRGLRASFVTSLEAFAPYVVGKLLIEQEDLRERFLRRLTWLAAIVAVLSVLEFRLARNLFVIAGTLLFSQPRPFHEQPRAGWMRIEGPYGSSIYVGLVFGALWILALWLDYANKENFGPRAPTILGIRRSMATVWVLFAGLIMTLSRGPWLGAIAAYGISRIGSAKNVKRTAVIVLLLGAVAGGATYAYLNAYTAGDISNAKDEDQANAIYRRLLLANYAPIVKEGGVFGWGPEFPRIEGQASIDNQYLWLRLAQGPWGLWSFLLLAAESCLCLIAAAGRSRRKQDFFLCMSLLAALAGMLVTLLTANLAPPGYELLFLFYGWSLSVQTQASAATVPVPLEASYRFRRTFA